MVKRGGRSYRKASQTGPRGGNTRRENVAQKIRDHRRRLRENNLADLRFHAKPAAKRADGRGGTKNDYAVYGIYRDGSKWVLTGMACTDEIEKVNHHRGGGYSRTEVRGRYVMTPRRGGDLRPADGIELDRFETKQDAMRYVSADASERVEAGAYLVRPEHNPRTRFEEVDKDDFHQFKHDAVKIWNDEDEF